MFRLPLHGIHVIDLTCGLAGAFATRHMGDMGAEVIKVESPSRPDPLRKPESFPGMTAFNRMHRNKYGCLMDFREPRGRDLVLRLAAATDALVEDMTDGEAESLGLTYDALRALNGQLIVISIRPGAGSAASAGAAAAGALALALWHLRRTDEVQHIAVGDDDAAPETPGWSSAPEPMAPHGCYPCADGGWVAIACENDEEFAALCTLMEQPSLASDPRFADAASRARNRAALDKAIAAWTRSLPRDEVVAELQLVLVPAAPVLTDAEVPADPHLRARGYWEPVSHPGGVSQIERPLWRLSETPAHIRLPAPQPGEHDAWAKG